MKKISMKVLVLSFGVLSAMGGLLFCFSGKDEVPSPLGLLVPVERLNTSSLSKVFSNEELVAVRDGENYIYGKIVGPALISHGYASNYHVDVGERKNVHISNLFKLSP